MYRKHGTPFTFSDIHTDGKSKIIRMFSILIMYNQVQSTHDICIILLIGKHSIIKNFKRIIKQNQTFFNTNQYDNCKLRMTEHLKHNILGKVHVYIFANWMSPPPNRGVKPDGS